MLRATDPFPNRLDHLDSSTDVAAAKPTQQLEHAIKVGGGKLSDETAEGLANAVLQVTKETSAGSGLPHEMWHHVGNFMAVPDMARAMPTSKTVAVGMRNAQTDAITHLRRWGVHESERPAKYPDTESWVAAEPRDYYRRLSMWQQNAPEALRLVDEHGFDPYALSVTANWNRGEPFEFESLDFRGLRHEEGGFAIAFKGHCGYGRAMLNSVLPEADDQARADFRFAATNNQDHGVLYFEPGRIVGWRTDRESGRVEPRFPTLPPHFGPISRVEMMQGPFVAILTAFGQLVRWNLETLRQDEFHEQLNKTITSLKRIADGSIFVKAGDDIYRLRTVSKMLDLQIALSGRFDLCQVDSRAPLAIVANSNGERSMHNFAGDDPPIPADTVFVDDEAAGMLHREGEDLKLAWGYFEAQHGDRTRMPPELRRRLEAIYPGRGHPTVFGLGGGEFWDVEAGRLFKLKEPPTLTFEEAARQAQAQADAEWEHVPPQPGAAVAGRGRSGSCDVM